MKLQTSIQPRGDGTVVVVGEDGKDHVFKTDEDGALVCDVDDEATVSKLLLLGDFEPVNEEDYADALSLTRKSAEEDPEDDAVDETSDPNALPIEANTAPKAPAKKAATKTTAKKKA